MLGAPYSAEAWAAAVHPDDAAAFAEACQRAARGEPSEVGYRIVRADGETREIWDRFAPSRGGTAAGVRVDVTERRTTERELSSAQHRLESLLRQLDDAVLTLEVLPDGGIADAGVPGSAADGDLLDTDRVHPDDLATFTGSLDAIRRGERVAIRFRRLARRAATPAVAAQRAARGARRPALRGRHRQRRHRSRRADGRAGRDAQSARPRAGQRRRRRLHARAGRGHGGAVGDLVRRPGLGAGHRPRGVDAARDGHLADGGSAPRRPRVRRAGLPAAGPRRGDRPRVPPADSRRHPPRARARPAAHRRRGAPAGRRHPASTSPRCGWPSRRCPRRTTTWSASCTRSTRCCTGPSWASTAGGTRSTRDRATRGCSACRRRCSRISTSSTRCGTTRCTPTTGRPTSTPGTPCAPTIRWRSSTAWSRTTGRCGGSPTAPRRATRPTARSSPTRSASTSPSTAG